MKKTITFLSVFALVTIALGANSTTAADITVTVTNTTHGSYFTPLLISAHSEGQHLFEAGQPAGADVQAMAEGGDISGLEAQMDAINANSISNPAGGLLGPGSSTSASINTDGTDNSVLSLVAMILPTNDGFVGLDALPLPQTPGVYVYYLNAYDAGTEANDELVVGGAGGAPGTPGIPADPGGHAGTNATGAATADDNSTVHIHRGVLGDNNPLGGFSDLDSTRHRWLNPVAKLAIEVF
jgi:hypothetical protein